ncbi:MAG: DUF5106 domain-containing protein [Paramuribaculum sp.]|nr:DUF5106 domain-containing protein [Paramuribaculum sp.]
MKYILPIILILVSIRSNAQDSDPYFPLPLIPDSISNFNNRCDYMVTHYWDFCDTKRAFSSRDKMAEAFKVYLSFMPYATADTVMTSIDKFLKRIEKQPKDVAFIADQAIEKLYSDSSEFVSDQLCLKFIDNAISNSKVKKEDKLRFNHLSTKLHNSATGSIAPDFNYTDCSGETHRYNVADSTCMATILFFNDPDCDECRMSRVKLDADIHTTKLIDAGVVRIAAITPDSATDDWCDKASRFPDTWTVGASEDIDEIFDLRVSPSFYLLNYTGKIMLKHATVDMILNITNQLSVPKNKQHTSSE